MKPLHTGYQMEPYFSFIILYEEEKQDVSLNKKKKKTHKLGWMMMQVGKGYE